MYFDWTYLVMLLPALLLSMWASARVNSTFRKYQKIGTRRQISGAEAARMVLNAQGLFNVAVEQVEGELSDHYDPQANVVRLSDSVYGSRSAAAVGVACHEAGHAVQYNQGYGPVKLRTAIIPMTAIGAKLSGPLIMAGFFLASFSYSFIFLCYIGIALFALSTLFQLLTLPVEFNASRRALEAIEDNNILYEDEIPGARRVLSAAALTYVAALAVSLVQLLRFIMLVNRGRRR